jgi:hypothetical protein
MTSIQKLRKIQKTGELDKCFQGYNETSIGSITIKSQSAGVCIQFENKVYTYYNGNVFRGC